MANKNLFQTVKRMFTPQADIINEAGGRAYKLSPKHALAQYAATGTFTRTFYAEAGEQLRNTGVYPTPRGATGFYRPLVM